MTSGIQLVKAFDQRMGVYRYVASNQVSPEVFKQLVAEDERSRKEAVMVQNNGVSPAARAAIDAARAEGRAEGIEAERKRHKAIMSSPHAAMKPTFAKALADDGVSVEAAIRMLQAAPNETSNGAGAGYQTIEQRAAAEKEIGADNFYMAQNVKHSGSGPWGHVVNKIKGAK